MGTGRKPGVTEREAGMSLLELLMALSALLITMGGLSLSQVTSIALSRGNQESARAADAAQSVLEELRDEDDFATIYARWNRTSDDDPAGAPGASFDVPGLDPVADDPDGRVGEVIFPGNGTVLLEDARDWVLGTPRDLDLDGSIDGSDQADDYRILPVLVRVRWQSGAGVRQVQLVTTLARR